MNIKANYLKNIYNSKIIIAKYNGLKCNNQKKIKKIFKRNKLMMFFLKNSYIKRIIKIIIENSIKLNGFNVIITFNNIKNLLKAYKKNYLNFIYPMIYIKNKKIENTESVIKIIKFENKNNIYSKIYKVLKRKVYLIYKLINKIII